MKKKLAMLFGIVLLALVILILRITYINATSGSKYKKQVLSQAQQKYESQVLPAKRGDIYDKNGKHWKTLKNGDLVYQNYTNCNGIMYLRNTPGKNMTKIMYLDEYKSARIVNQNLEEEYIAIIDSKNYILNINNLSINLKK